MLTINKTLKSTILALSALASLTACDELKGQIQVQEALKLNVVKGNSTVAPGVYDIKLRPEPSKNKIRLEVSVAGKKNNPVADFRSPRGLPTYSGPIRILAAESGQPYDADGFFEEDVFESAPRREYRSCSIPHTVRECHVDQQGVRKCK